MKFKITGTDCNYYPSDGMGRCPVCKKEFKYAGFAFMTFGAHPMKHNGCMDRYKGPYRFFWDIGFHGNECSHPELMGRDLGESYFTEELIDIFGKGCSDFEFTFCSIKCMKSWFCDLFDDFSQAFKEEYGFEPGPNPRTPLFVQGVPSAPNSKENPAVDLKDDVESTEKSGQKE